jgi:hypothetical protein
VQVTCAVEGATDVPIVDRLLLETGHHRGPTHGLNGKDELDRNLPGYNAAARSFPWLVLRDLDREPCATALVARLVPDPSVHMRLRVAVRAIEAWLLADRAAIASFLAVSVSLVPQDPDALTDPKADLVNLARRSRKKAIKVDMTPSPKSSARVGPAYISRIVEFSANKWNPRRAAENSDSLHRCIRALDRFRA